MLVLYKDGGDRAEGGKAVVRQGFDCHVTLLIRGELCDTYLQYFRM